MIQRHHYNHACRTDVQARETCRVLLVGEDNPQSSEPEHALFPYPVGCAGHRLMGILGLRQSDYLALWRTNLCNPSWSIAAARKRALDILGDVGAEWDVVVLLGAKVAEAAHYPLRPFTAMRARVAPEPGVVIRWDREGETFRPSEGDKVVVSLHREGETFRPSEGDKVVVSLPHPSGRNLTWNDPASKLRAQAIMRTVAPEFPWGAS